MLRPKGLSVRSLMRAHAASLRGKLNFMFTTPEGIGILFAKQKFLFGEISGIYKLGFEKTFCSIKHVERSLFARLFPCRFYMHVIWRHGVRMGLCM